MCIVLGTGVKCARNDIMVYKILNDSHSIFRSMFGNSTEIAYKYESKNFINFIDLPSVGFDQGFGYSVFRSLKIATEYLKKLNLMAKVWYIPGISLSFKIHQFIIPKDSLYENGTIDLDLIGGCLSATRTDLISTFKGTINKEIQIINEWDRKV